MRPIDYNSYKTTNTCLKMIHFVEAVNAYRNKKEHAHCSLVSACINVADSEAPQYYISAKHALEMYSIWKRFGKIPNQTECDKKKFEEIFARYEEVRKLHPGIKEKFSSMMTVLSSPASSFFINHSGVLDFYYRAIIYKRSLVRKK